MFESMSAFMLLEHFYGRHLAQPGEDDADGRHSPGYPRLLTPWRRPQRTADGHVCILPYTTAHWKLFFEHAGHPELASDPRFQDIASRTRHIAELYEIAGEIVARRDTAHWLELCKRLEIPAAPVNRLEDMEHDPHLKAVGLFPTVHGDDGSVCRLVRNPVRLADSEVPMRMPPSLGEHTLEVLAEAGLDADAIGRLVGSGAARTHATGPGSLEQDG